MYTFDNRTKEVCEISLNGKDQEKMSENMKLQGMISDDGSVIYSSYSKNKPILKIYDIKTK